MRLLQLGKGVARLGTKVRPPQADIEAKRAELGTNALVELLQYVYRYT